ncbi:hypothetical protein EM808_27170 [Niallia taxi]|uniref:Uncharacterized protein n=1 Tax=Niallia taxi TaxID=2499688 RepID=A0A437K369_9BACI|nr:hypothetical protein EM808_27170 [Niallia taxi]
MTAAIINEVKRGLFFNGAGIGGDPIPAATASVSHPAKQGFIQGLGVFFDTLLVCSATAFIILTSEAYGSGLTGIELSLAAMVDHSGSWGGAFLGIAIFLWRRIICCSICQMERSIYFPTLLYVVQFILYNLT